MTKQIQLVKSLTYYNTTLKQNVLMVGKGEQSDNYISNGTWLLQRKFFTPKSIEKWNTVQCFSDNFINSYKNDKGKAQHDLTKKDIQKIDETYFIKVGSTNLILDTEIKERIIDVLLENKGITFKYYETPYTNQFLHIFEKGEFIGLTLVNRG